MGMPAHNPGRESFSGLHPPPSLAQIRAHEKGEGKGRQSPIFPLLHSPAQSSVCRAGGVWLGLTGGAGSVCERVEDVKEDSLAIALFDHCPL